MKKVVALLFLVLFSVPAFAWQESVASSIQTHHSGKKSVTTSGTAVQLSTSSTVYNTAEICADFANTGLIAVGGSDVVASATINTTKGVPLSPGRCISFGDSRSHGSGNLSLDYIDATVNGEGVNFSYETDL